MKRRLTILTAVLLLCTACSGTQTAEEKPSLDSLGSTENVRGAQMEIAYSHSWAGKLVANAEFGSILLAGDKLLLNGIKTSDAGNGDYYLYDMKSDALTEPFHFTEKYADETDYSLSVNAVVPSGEGYALVYSYTPISEDMSQSQQFVEYYDADWNYLSETELTITADDKVISSVVPTESGYCVLESAWSNGDYYLVDKDWNRIDNQLHGTNGGELFTGADGSVYLATDNRISRVDQVSGVKESLKIEGLPEQWKGVCSGYGDVLFGVYDSEAFYAVHADMTAEVLADWAASDIMGEYLINVIMTADGRLCVSTYGDDGGIYLLTRRTEEEMQNMELITLASVMDSTAISAAVNSFNRQSKTIRIVMQDYEDYFDNDAAPGHYRDKCIEMFEKDLLSGNVPDIICTDSLPWENYVDKGLFEDLYAWMEADEDFHKDDYVMNFFDAMAYEGKLYRFGNSFSLSTVVGRTDMTGDAQGLTFADYNRIAQSVPEGMLFTERPTKSYVLDSFCTGIMNTYIDTKTAECHLDSPEMIGFLEFCNTFPDDLSMYSAEEGDICLKAEYFYSPGDFHERIANDFGDADVSFIGYPTADGIGNGAQFACTGEMAMYSQSAHKAEIWEFFKYLLSEEMQDSSVMYLPVRRSSLQKQIDTAIQESDGTITQTEMDTFLSVIDATTKSDYYNYTISNIVSEEAQMFFAGDQTAQQAADNMQSRVSIYLAEHS